MKSQYILEINNISKEFRGIKAIRECNLSIKRDKIVALIGPNGAGKSTLINIISGFILTKKGSIKFKNKDISKLKPYERYNLGIARTFQGSKLFYDLTIKDNLSICGAYNKEALEILDSMGITDLMSNSSKLSGGQRRIVEIIRAIISKCDLILLDEPFSGLHPENRVKITQLIKENCKGKTFFITDHDVDMILSISDEILIIKGGKISSLNNVTNLDKVKILEMMYGLKD